MVNTRYFLHKDLNQFFSEKVSNLTDYSCWAGKLIAVKIYQIRFGKATLMLIGNIAEH
jgi:hypothetical protein